MTLRNFLKKNRKTIDTYIRLKLGETAVLNDRERELWVNNDEWLYSLALSAGVRI